MMDLASAAALPGGYALELRLARACVCTPGRLGEPIFPAGVYVYLGSARGPGGLRARLNRHLRPAEAIRPHWHVDELRRFAPVAALAWVYAADGAPPDLECRWSQALAALPGAFLPAAGFGAGDCRSGCGAHLVGFAPAPFVAGVLTAAGVLAAAEVQAALARAAGIAPHALHVERPINPGEDSGRAEVQLSGKTVPMESKA